MLANDASPQFCSRLVVALLVLLIRFPWLRAPRGIDEGKRENGGVFTVSGIAWVQKNCCWIGFSTFIFLSIEVLAVFCKVFLLLDSSVNGVDKNVPASVGVAAGPWSLQV
jgi:hypothetical protein